MLRKIGLYSLYRIVILGLVSTSLLTLTQSGEAVSSSHSAVHVLSCISSLSDSANHSGMRVSYNPFKHAVTVNFMRQDGSTATMGGYCVIKGVPWSNAIHGKFCHFGVDDVIYKRSLMSMNITSEKAPYLLKIFKSGSTFWLRVRSGDPRCLYGLTVVN